MGRRGQECRCCGGGGCSDCDTTPALIKAHIVYPVPEGSEIVAADDSDPPQWTSVTTTCGVPPERVQLVKAIFITDPGEGYTSPPVLSLTGDNGSLLSQLITIESGVSSFTVTKAGSGYSTSPSVKFGIPPGGGRITTATAIARVEGPITTLTLTNGGIDYSAPPQVTFATGTGATASLVMDTYVSALQLTSPGSEYTSAPSVTISGGGGSGATAQALIDKAAETVSSLVLLNKGSGYTSPPVVTISGAEGKAATATASISFTVQSISLVAGGSGYPPNPDVTISGGGGSGATATAKITGSVVGVDVINPGLYLNSNANNGGTSFPDWPTVTLTGGGGSGAAVVPVFAGKLRQAGVNAGGYTTPPTVAFAGGSGTGAAGIAQLEWERDHVRLELIQNCTAIFSGSFGSGSNFLPTFLNCLDGTAAVLPPAPAGQCIDNAELVAWAIQIKTDADGFSQPLATLPSPLYFPGEAIRATLTRAWGAIGTRLSGNIDITQLRRLIYSEITKHYTQRFFSRVEPDIVYRIDVPTQLQANNVTLTPTFRQYADTAGEPYWYLESIAITNAGQNLRIPLGTTTCQLAADGNSRHVVGSAAITVNRSAPVVAVPVLDGWNVQPTISVTVSPVGGEQLHEITAVSVAAGGSTEQEDGTFLIDLSLTLGHFAGVSGRAQLTATITSGTLTTVVIANASEIIGPSTLATIELPADLEFNNNNRRVTGESLFKTTRIHLQPTVTATQEIATEEGIVLVTLGVTLAEDTDLNGEQYWYVASLSGSVPLGNPAGVIFEVEAPGIEASPAVASRVFDSTGQGFTVVHSGGKYFVRTTTPTSEPLPPISCIGEISESNGWSVNNQELITANYFGAELNETFIAKYQHIPGPGQPSTFPEVTRTRRCRLPNITLELE